MWMDARRMFYMPSFLSPLRANFRCPCIRRSGLNRILASPYGPRSGSGNTGFPLKKVSPYSCFSLALGAWISGHTSDTALALRGTWTSELTCGVSFLLSFASQGLPRWPIGPPRALPRNRSA